MPAAIPPQEHRWFASTLDGKFLMRHGVAEIEMRWNASAADEEENGKKKVSKEIQRERQKEQAMDASRMVEVTKAVMGGYGYWLDGQEEAKTLRQILGYQKWHQLTGFLNMQRLLKRTFVPELKKEIQQEMLAKFKTLDYETLKKRLLTERFADPELDVLTSKGQVMKTSFLTLKARSDARKAIELEALQK